MTRMDPRLKGSTLPLPKVLASPLSKQLKSQEGFHDLQTFYPGMGLFCKAKEAPDTDMWFDHANRIIDILHRDSKKTSGRVSLRIESNQQESGANLQDISGFCKITHLLDPVRWLQGKYSLPKHAYLPWHQTTWEAAWNKLQDPMNQAYIEALASYAFGKLRESDVSPHFHLFYGSLCGKADTYSYNITDSYMSYRHARWFWTGQEKQLFQLQFDENIPDEVKQAILEQPDSLDDSSDDASSEASEESLEGLSCPDTPDNQSLHSLKELEELDIDSVQESEEEDDSDEHTDDDEDIEIFADVKQFPVMMIFTESSEGTMDDLLDNYEEVGCKPGSGKWELTWKAWIFQLIAALSVGQSLFGFTHNDLHSNNVVWSKTDKPYLYYKLRDGTLFKVPTFGKIFRIIDFGRAIFTLNDKVFFSDDFKKGNDAAEQFNFGDLYDASEPEVYPNPSFDLCRFTVSVFESLFPECPPLQKGGSILSEEPDLIVKETTSQLYNTMWSWLLCDDGHNVLMDPDGTERYPDFDLYKVITQQVHKAVPAEQFMKPLFECFQTKEIVEKAYSLFC
jgi:hypothetical protein